MFDDQALELLRQKILVEQETVAEQKRKNDILEREARARDTADKIKVRIALDTNEKVSGLVAQLPQVFLTIYGIQESLKEQARRQDRAEEIFLLLLTGKGNGNKQRIDELRKELSVEHLERQLLIETQNLNEIEEQIAHYGLDVPLQLVNTKRKIKEKIDELQSKLNECN